MNKISRFEGEFRFLSNFYHSPITYQGLHYKNVEAAYQSAKTLDMDVRAEFCDLSAKDAKAKGRTLTLRDDWENVKFSVMHDCLVEKFSDRVLMKKLLATGDIYLEEGNWWGDTYWGVCHGQGQNHLGYLLMQIRRECRENDMPLQISRQKSI